MDKFKNFVDQISIFFHAVLGLVSNLGVSKDGYREIFDKFVEDMKTGVDNL